MRFDKKLFYLSGADTFLLALESHDDHDVLGNQTCHYMFILDGIIDEKSLEKAFNQHAEIALNQFQISGRHKFLRPHWESSEKTREIPVKRLEDSSQLSFEESYKYLLSSEGEMNAEVICQHDREHNKSLLIFRWNHLLMDAFGSYHLLKIIGQEEGLDNVLFYPKPISIYFKLWPFYKIVRFISNTSHKPIFFPSEQQGYENIPHIRIKTFSVEQSVQIAGNASRLGSPLSHADFILACVAKVIDNNFQEAGDFWVPIPVNTRKKGLIGPIFTNPLSFYFFRIKRNLCQNIEKNIEDIQKQMAFQSKKNYPFVYRKLTEFMRFLPLNFYYIFVKGWKRKSHASFMFTFANKHTSDFNKFLGHDISDALNVPPNTYPPGLTFSFMEYRDQLKLTFLYREQIIPPDKAESLIEELSLFLLQD